MKIVKQICAIFFALLAIVGLLGLAEVALMKALHLTDSAPPAGAVIKLAALALISATICVVLMMSAAKDNETPAK